jgi:hypothetical protein
MPYDGKFLRSVSVTVGVQFSYGRSKKVTMKLYRIRANKGLEKE